jgi:hypothetical protein
LNLHQASFWDNGNYLLVADFYSLYGNNILFKKNNLTKNSTNIWPNLQQLRHCTRLGGFEPMKSELAPTMVSYGTGTKQKTVSWSLIIILLVLWVAAGSLWPQTAS